MAGCRALVLVPLFLLGAAPHRLERPRHPVLRHRARRAAGGARSRLRRASASSPSERSPTRGPDGGRRGPSPVTFLLLLAWWGRIPPLTDRDWAPEYAVLPRATVEGDQVTLRNVRNFDYRTETDFTPRYEDRIYDLGQLDSLDLVASYWMGEAIAHVMLSFGFTGEEFVTFSVETRRERTEGYSTVKGFFKQYELFYVVADERDVIRLRTNYREEAPEDVYVYRTAGSPDEIRRVFLDYLREINVLAGRPPGTTPSPRTARRRS